MAKSEGKQPTFEEALTQMESIATAIEEGKIGLEQMIAEYEKAMKLDKYCRSVLADAEAKIQKLQLAADGTLEPRPMEPPAEGE